MTRLANPVGDRSGRRNSTGSPACSGRSSSRTLRAISVWRRTSRTPIETLSWMFRQSSPWKLKSQPSSLKNPRLWARCRPSDVVVMRRVAPGRRAILHATASQLPVSPRTMKPAPGAEWTVIRCSDRCRQSLIVNAGESCRKCRTRYTDPGLNNSSDSPAGSRWQRSTLAPAFRTLENPRPYSRPPSHPGVSRCGSSAFIVAKVMPASTWSCSVNSSSTQSRPGRRRAPARRWRGAPCPSPSRRPDRAARCAGSRRGG